MPSQRTGTLGKPQKDKLTGRKGFVPSMVDGTDPCVVGVIVKGREFRKGWVVAWHSRLSVMRAWRPSATTRWIGLYGHWGKWTWRNADR